LSLEDFIEKYKIDTLEKKQTGIITESKFKMWSAFPFVIRDIAVWCDTVEVQTKLEEIISTFAKKYCVRESVLFDRFEKDGRISVAYRFVFQSYEKTLTEAEVEAWFGGLVEKIRSVEGFDIR
jgi:phenylalanyl-tRNA synthetase beta subunit